MNLDPNLHSMAKLKHIIAINPLHLQLRVLRKHLKEGYKYLTLITQRDYMEKLSNRGEATKDIIATAKKMVSPINKERSKKDEKHLMNRRILDKNKEIDIQKKRFEESRIKVETKMIPVAKDMMKEVRKYELNRCWQIEKGKMQKKLNWNLRHIENEDTVDGIIFKDKDLHKKFDNPTVEPVILGGIEASDNVKAFLRLPDKFKLVEKLSQREAKIEAEVSVAKMRLNVRDWEEGENKDAKDILLEREREHKDRSVYSNGCINFSNVRATEMKHNKVSYPVKLDDKDREVKIQIQKEEVLGSIKVASAKVDTRSNLTREEFLGRKEIEDGIKNKEWMLYHTDKSGKMVLDTKENYLRSMMPHYEGNHEATFEEIGASESILNAHSRCIARIISLGEHSGPSQKMRAVGSLMVKDSGVPTLQGMRKDHKTGWDPVSGPPLRPLCDGKVGPNAPLGNLLSKILQPYREDLNSKDYTEALSTEDLLRTVEDFNVR